MMQFALVSVPVTGTLFGGATDRVEPHERLRML